MRPKFAFAILSVAVLATIGIVFLKQHPSTTTVAPVPVASVAPTASQPAPTPAPVAVKKTMTPEEQEAAIEAEKDKLYAWSMNNDSQSFSNILGDLTSSEKEIREAAIEAAKQFGDTNAIPVLKALAANDSDNQEAIEMLEAADFISLPDAPLTRHSDAPLTAEQQQRRSRSEAHRQAQLQKRGITQNQNTQTGRSQNAQSAPAQP